MDALTDLKGLLSSAKSIAEKQQKVVNEQMDVFFKDKNASQEDKDFIRMMNANMEQAFKNGDSGAIHSIINELTNKIKK
jgi:hypothetical protein